ncbi:SDR family NAD(P)-dependent oxidoreductase [Stigmatella aurantiaca]|uniref:Oxidoreductase, short chain dehydrogenase/reductase family n=1 Tax=Stigmatella aurantiaca (strain DW4/3-1) TaxID=378806 RepID=E3FR96_STIAD|nr:SDR family oxidoreductase [Stigmatella aurantiaca]ADO74488.1 Oxidoreductase, short chain dehydrogenase/reductase family [Stigmatella aurantiaca DW4/3-1]
MNNSDSLQAPPAAPAALPPPALELEEVRRCAQLLEAIVADRRLLLRLPEPERIALLSAAGKVVLPERDVRARLVKSLRKEQKQAKRKRDQVVRASTEIRTLRQAPVFTAPAPRLLGENTGPERLLENPRNCYVCKEEFKRLHFFYDAMCPTCADFNYAKRFQTAPLEGKVALITGARVKIGFQASLMLLRSGARVIATTRFPNDAAERYAREPDFAAWSHRLHVHGLDLRHAPSVELFARYVDQAYERLDILINNAAQTVRRPPGFYAHLLSKELLPVGELPKACAPLLQGHQECLARVQPALGAGTSSTSITWRSADPAVGLHSSAALSLVPYALEQEGDTQRIFPQGRLDADLQQVDLREMNSWRLRLAEVETAEMLEVHLVNAVAPFILCGKLKPLMLRNRTEIGHIVNVSAMEGSFSRGKKTDKHPHTNMAKAALNMMTLTSAPDYARDGIYMNAVDTGWVTDEDPAIHAQRKQEELDFHPPLDIVDGAARVVDPVFMAVKTGQGAWGNFFKDYRHTSW